VPALPAGSFFAPDNSRGDLAQRREGIPGQVLRPVGPDRDIVLDPYSAVRRKLVNQIPIHLARLRHIAQIPQQLFDEVKPRLYRRYLAGFEGAGQA